MLKSAKGLVLHSSLETASLTAMLFFSGLIMNFIFIFSVFLSLPLAHSLTLSLSGPVVSEKWLQPISRGLDLHKKEWYANRLYIPITKFSFLRYLFGFSFLFVCTLFFPPLSGLNCFFENSVCVWECVYVFGKVGSSFPSVCSVPRGTGGGSGWQGCMQFVCVCVCVCVCVPLRSLLASQPWP